MNKKPTKISLCLAILSLIFYVAAACAEPMGNGPSPNGQKEQRYGGEKSLDKLAQELNLTQEQQELIKEHRAQHREKMEQVMQALKDKKMQLRQELEKQEIDKNKIDVLISEIKPLMGEQLDLRIEGILAMKDIFTAEQYQKFQQTIKEKAQRGPARKFRKRKGIDEKPEN